ncbi:dTDP-4-keto-6-deoxy-D-glucose 3,5-epimerase [Aggregatibacter actinomycetemcomitans serotype e str. SC1083]|uniref:dTDP-4-dehydrorhamnose 3,5-epimerase n=2 Tax=Aggregatibacter actinomycetemcomitans TaxID=714 RepID=G4A6W3_AGGAC|nr:dTDP-4-dehydrorhamnose 3,5-epimerase [Aggregatibacter actinomycetemcomitans]EGY34167.1 dTDP-4-keto-6-deoxy-D-glucose 3,5-epimerase [Aggregatibacter actinomycetemcomitans serotype e str. SC1083]KYK81338.1 dTDP-4-dehydrorhamnose 3,5-epimerase [Aggregatibacter actinomycetemcomitans serotype e str. SC936]KYK95696.1 dTDP-4-dehydrorhamnose 3,5-epimerase [Aggregatibacter actinomycetemcomitans serotype e str. ANH9776]TYB22399.1 dTDP-4-dehydrorhamnose 3,5-epimerase [Aggregatibacter actinomycetemcomit
MKVIDTKIPDVKLLEPQVFGDERGFFMETFRDEWFRENVADRTFVQENHSKSIKGVLRGLHYQTENTQGKLVRVISGAVFDVAVDMRENSLTFGQWVGEVLSAENKHQLWVPEGFAHGFYVLTDEAEFTYKCTDYYNPRAEHSLIWNDQTVGVEWPIYSEPNLSAKDLGGKMLAEAVKF